MKENLSEVIAQFVQGRKDQASGEQQERDPRLEVIQKILAAKKK